MREVIAINQKKRKRLSEAVALLRRAGDIISSVESDESNCLDNVPENLEYSEKAERLSDNCDALCDAEDYVDEAVSKVEMAMGV